MSKAHAFERYVKRYERWFVRNRFAYESEVGTVRALLPAGSGVEVGVGTGRFAAPLGLELGVEPSRAMGRVAVARGVQVVQGIAEALPFSEARFDFLLMVATICFLDDVEAVFREACRVLRPGGSILIGFIDRDSALGRAYEARKEEDVFYREATFYCASDVAALLRAAGFEGFAFRQTIFRDRAGMRHVEPAKEGHGEGSFVVVRGVK